MTRSDLHFADMDVQHRRLSALMTSLRQSLKECRSAETLLREFENMVEYFQLHFSDEEEFMVSDGYPADLLNNHRREHLAAVQYLQRSAQDLRDRNACLETGVIDEIEGKLDGHTATLDVIYRAHFTQLVEPVVGSSNE